MEEILEISDEQLKQLERVYYLYLDEFGHSSYIYKRVYNRVLERYLTLAGVLIRGDVWWTHLCPQLEQLKQKHFGRTDFALHYSELSQGRGQFGTLRTDQRREFWRDFLAMLKALPCQLVSLTIDKQLMQEQYKNPFEAYHSLLAFHVERLVYFLERTQRTEEALRSDRIPNLRGKLIIEARNEKSDNRLKESYRRIYEKGHKLFKNLSVENIQGRLESKELTICSKAERRKGLEVADLVCNPMHWNAIMEFAPEVAFSLNGVTTKSEGVESFWGELHHKIAASENGEILGYGIKIFPDKSA